MGRPMLWRTRHSFLASEAHSLTSSKLVRDADCRQRVRQRVRLGGGVIGLPWAQLPWKFLARKVIEVSATAVVALSFGSLALLWASA